MILLTNRNVIFLVLILFTYLNNETIDIKINIICKNIEANYHTSNLLVLDKNRVTNTYKIKQNEWLKGL